MKKRMNVLAKVLSAIIVASLMTVGIPRGCRGGLDGGDETRYRGISIKIFVRKKLCRLEILGVDEVTNSTVSPVQTKPVEKPSEV